MLRTALGRWRVMAWVTGVGLLLLTFGVIAKYVLEASWGEGFVALFGTLHGWLYMLYLLTTLQLGLQRTWSVWKMLVIALAGTIPFMSFVAEVKVHRQVLAEDAGAAEAAGSPPSPSPSSS